MSADDTDEDKTMQRLFAVTGRRAEPPDGMLERWESTFRTALEDTRRRRVARRQRWGTALLGIVVAGVLAGTWLRSMPQSTPPQLAQVIQANGPSEVLGRGPVTAGNPLFEGEVIQTGSDGYLAVRYRDVRLLLDADTRIRLGRVSLVLAHGRLYVDTEVAGHRSARAVVVETPRGALRDVGTQFLAAFEDGELTVAVREGRVIFRHGVLWQQLEADAASADVMQLDSRGRVQRFREDRHGGRWALVVQASPELVFGNRTQHQILESLARQLGRNLEYADARARRHAEEHRSQGARPLDEAAAALAATSQLDIELDGATLRVSLERDQNADRGNDR